MTIDICKSVVDWRKRARKVLIEILGNKCAICGYIDEFSGAYDIHHINPEEKEINFGKLSSIGIKKCIIELKKCVLLCAICHRKIHAGILDISMATYYYNEAMAEEYLNFSAIPSSKCNKEIRENNLKSNYCYNCGKEICKKAKLCKECFHIAERRKLRPDVNSLMEDINCLGYVGTGKKYNVSDNTIRKWLKFYNKLNPRNSTEE